MPRLAANSSEMTESQSPSHTPFSEEEMALIEAAFATAATRSLVSSPSRASSSSSSSANLRDNVRSIKSITLLSKRSFSSCSSPQRDEVVVDVEDSGRLMSCSQMKRNRVVDSLLNRYRRRRGLAVTDITATGFAEGIWMVGVIDEIRMPKGQSDAHPMLVDTKTRVRASLPAEPQRRNGRLQLMCYKHLWDSSVADDFPSRQFFEFFSLNPNHILSAEIRENTAKCGFSAETLTDMLRYSRKTWCMLPPAHEQLLLRYELQEDQSLLGEDQFEYDLDWVKGQIKSSLEVWRGEREATYTPEDERWKCRSCKFASECPAGNSGSPRRKATEG
ncbi:unnamed protein product [Withania somnifera]